MRCMVIMAGLWALSGCAVPDRDSGTSVGNPNLTLVKVAPGGLGLTLDTASLPFSAVQVSNGAEVVDVELPDTNDVLVGAPLDLPEGDWTELAVIIDGTFDLAGSDGEGVVDLKLRLSRVAVRSERTPLQLDEPHVFELAFPGWLQADNAGWTAGEDHTVREGDVVHDVLVDLIVGRSALLPDPDGDGEPNRD